MKEVYEDEEGNRYIPIECEGCSTIVGYIDERDLADFNSTIWCGDCDNNPIEYKEVDE